MPDTGTTPKLLWNDEAIAEAATLAGVNDLESHIGVRLSATPTAAEMSLLVAKLPIPFASTVFLVGSRY